MTKLERRMSPEPVPYLAATQPPSAGPAVAATPMQAEQTQPQTEAANRAPAAAQPAEQTAANEPTAKREDAFAKAREADVMRTTEKRKAERRQQWVDRRRLQQREDQEMQDVERKVREDTGPRDFSERPARIEMLRMRPFGQDEDEQ